MVKIIIFVQFRQKELRLAIESFEKGSRVSRPSLFSGTKTTGAGTPVIQVFQDAFLLIDRWHSILDRNVLNNLSLLLDGPSLKWTERR
jgi:hypothetical protein